MRVLYSQILESFIKRPTDGTTSTTSGQKDTMSRLTLLRVDKPVLRVDKPVLRVDKPVLRLLWVLKQALRTTWQVQASTKNNMTSSSKH